MGYRGWKVWASYDMHISLLAIFYVLIADNLFRPWDSLILISSLGFYFMYGFLINDFFDMPYDIAAGKKRAVHELPKIVFITVILAVVFISALHLLYLKELSYIAIYAFFYLLATLYSAPPIRFKSRGFSGIVVNGLIEKTLPVLAIFAFFNHFGMDTFLFLATSFSIHTLEIVEHQILDYKNDLKTGIRSFIVNIGIGKALNIFKKFLSPFTGALIILLCLFVCINVPYAILLAAAACITYAVLFLLISKGRLNREEKICPLYISCLCLLILNAFPPFLALLLSLKDPLNTPLLLVALSSQYYVAKYRFKAIKEKALSRFEVFVETR